MKDRKEIGLALKAARKSLGVTQDNISEITGLSRAQIISIEKAERDYRVDTFLKYLKSIDAELTFVFKT